MIAAGPRSALQSVRSVATRARALAREQLSAESTGGGARSRPSTSASTRLRALRPRVYRLHGGPVIHGAMILGALGIQRTCRVTARVLAVVAGVLACTGSRASAGEIGHFNPAILSIRDYAMPAPGFYGALYNLWYTTDQLNGANGNAASSVTIPANHAPGRPSVTLKLDVSVDLYALAPTFMWVSDWKLLGAKYAAYIVPTFANTSLGAALSNETERGINPSTSSVGVGDMYVQPLWLDWTLEHFDVSLGSGFYAPTGKYGVQTS